MVKVAVYTVYRKSLHIFCLEIVCKDKTKIYFLYKMCLEKALAVIKDDDKCWFKNMAGLLSENHEKKAFTFYAPHTWAQSQAPVDPHSSLNCLKLHLQTTYCIQSTSSVKLSKRIIFYLCFCDSLALCLKCAETLQLNTCCVTLWSVL